MTHSRVPARRRALIAVTLCLFPVIPASAEFGSVAVPLAPHGDSAAGPYGSPTPLSSELFLVGVEGPDGPSTTADDQLLVVQVLTTPVVTALSTPFGPDWGGGVAVASATRGLMLHAGPDALWNTADDGAYLLDRLGSDNVVTSIPVGFLDHGDVHMPAWLDPDTFVVSTRGPDGERATADDEVVLVTDVGDTNHVTRLSAPYLPPWSCGKPVALSSTSFLVVNEGPDRSWSTPDDGVYLFTDVGGANTRTNLSAPNLFEYGASLPVRVTATRAVVCTTGPDGHETTADDRLYVFDDLGGSNTVKVVDVPSIQRWGGGLPLAFSHNTVLIATAGPDETQLTGDDTLATVLDLDQSAPFVEQTTIGGLSESASCRPVLLGDDVIAMATAGADGDYETADDAVVLVHGKGPVTEVVRIPIPCLGDQMTSRVVALGHDEFLVSHGGPDAQFGTADDCVTLVEDALEAWTTSSVAAPGGLSHDYSGHMTRVLGHGRGAIVCPGPDGVQRDGGDDLCLVMTGLPTRRDLYVTRTEVKFDPAKPAKAATISVKCALRTDGLSPFDRTDVTISIGNAAQQIPAGAFRVKKGVWTYSDRKARNGFLTKVTWNSKSESLTISGKGVGTGIETTHAAYVPVAVAGNGLYLAESFAATPLPKGKGFKFRRPILQ